MKTAFFPFLSEVVRALTLLLCAVALCLLVASVVQAAPRSEMVTPGHKSCAQSQAAARTTPVKPSAPVVASASPDRGHLPPTTRVAAAAPQCAAKALS